MKIYFTDADSGLTFQEAKDMGLVYISYPIIHGGVMHATDGDGKLFDPNEINTCSLNTEDYKRIFAPYIGNELVYISFTDPCTCAFRNLAAADIPNLTLVNSKSFGAVQVEIIKRVMSGAPYEDIKCFFVTRNTNKGSHIKAEKWTLFENQNEGVKILKVCETKYAAIQYLKKLINSKLYYGKDFATNCLRLHYGTECVYGMQFQK